MSFLLMLPLAIFAFLMLCVAGVVVSVEIAERRRARLHSRRIFRPVMIEGGKGKLTPTEHRQTAPAEPAAIRLVRSAPQ